MSALFISLGFDCDRPRGGFVETLDGHDIALRKQESIRRITTQLNQLNIKRTFFICGMFLESMGKKFGDNVFASVFDSGNPLVEIGDHTYSHRVLKKILTRPDKIPMTIREIEEEYKTNTYIFTKMFGHDLNFRGYRTPLGHFDGLKDNPEITEILQSIGVSYVSSDLRDDKHSLCPEFFNSSGKLRQPYFYSSGLLEIPSIGWQDTVFSGTTKTKLFKPPPTDYPTIILYYRQLFTEAKRIATSLEINFFLSLVFHPYDVSIYDKDGRFFYDLVEISQNVGSELIRYKDIKSKFMSNMSLKSE